MLSTLSTTDLWQEKKKIRFLNSDNKESKLFLLDMPLVTSMKSSISNEGVFEHEGFVIERLTYEWIKEYLMDKNYITITDEVNTYENYCWMEPFTEIDIVICNDTKKIIFWGSCKRDFQKQELKSLISHVFSYYNNRGFESDKTYDYSHVLMFISPEKEESKCQKLAEKFNSIQSYFQGNIDEIIETLVKWATKKLSGYFNESNNPFALKSKPTKMFSIHEGISLSFSELIETNIKKYQKEM